MLHAQTLRYENTRLAWLLDRTNFDRGVEERGHCGNLPRHTLPP
jgi:hypothetical protein